MPKTTNVEAFQMEAAILLAEAYKNFPVPFCWDVDPDNEFYPTDLGATRAEIQSHTIHWLSDHGYLTNGGLVGSWRDLQLTERGLHALNSVPDAVSGKDPIGKRLVVAVGKGSWDIVKELIPAAIKQGLGWLE